MLYHREVYWPFKNTPSGVWNLEYTAHALNAAKDDRYGSIPLPSTLDISQLAIFEIETDSSQKIVKICGRMALDAKRDVCYAIGIEGSRRFVKTVWVNLRSDKHKTLQRWKYATK